MSAIWGTWCYDMSPKGHPRSYIEFRPYGYPLEQALLCHLQLPLGAVPCHWHLCCPAATSVALSLPSQLQDIQGLLTKPQPCCNLNFSLTYQWDPGTPHQKKTKQATRQQQRQKPSQTKPNQNPVSHGWNHVLLIARSVAIPVPLHHGYSGFLSYFVIKQEKYGGNNFLAVGPEHAGIYFSNERFTFIHLWACDSWEFRVFQIHEITSSYLSNYTGTKCLDYFL